MQRQVHSESVFEAMDIFLVKLAEDINRPEAIDNSQGVSCVFFL